jgi:CRP-like cAMP-binding protein
MTSSNPERDTHAAALRGVPFLRELDRQSLMELAAASRVVNVGKGEDIFAEGDPCRGMFLLLSGSVKIYRAASSGREQIIAVESVGAVIAELPLLDGQAYPASCAAIEESRLLLVPRAAFEEILRRRPELALGVLRVLGERLRHLVALVDELSLLEVPQRLAKYLLETSEKRGSDFTLSLSNQEIASRLGTVRELVSRNLHRFEQQGAIAIDGRRIRILDEQALRDRIDS